MSLSLSKGKPVCIIDDNPNKKIYINTENVFDDEDKDANIETTRENREKIFKNFIKLDKKLTSSEMNKMIECYKDESKVDNVEEHLGKLSRKYEDAKMFVNNSLKKFLDYGKDATLFPIVEPLDKASCHLFLSGQTGSGKSYFLSQFLKHNPPKKLQPILLFSPVKNDPSLKSIKGLVQVDLVEFEEEHKRDLEYDDIPEKAICLFDDIESDSNFSKFLMNLRDKVLEVGRHKCQSCFTISHNPMGHNKTKASIRESFYAVIFPHSNPRDCGALLSKYFGYTKKMIDEVMATKSRWVMVSKRVPQYWVSSHSIRLQ